LVAAKSNLSWKKLTNLVCQQNFSGDLLFRIYVTGNGDSRQIAEKLLVQL
jgi:hypothetical protein